MSAQAKLKRDYSLAGGHERAVALDDDRIETHLEEDDWWAPRLPRAQLLALLERRDGPGLRHFGLWFALLAITGYLATLAWGSWWAIPAFLLYGTIYSSSDARWHECGHGTPFRTRWLNEICYHISSFMTIREGFLWRWSHARHHTDTIIVGRDPEIQVQRPADLVKLALDFFYLRGGPPEVLRVIRHALGRPDSDVRDYVPEPERQRMYWSSRVYLLIIAAVIALAIQLGNVLPLLFVWTPRFYAGWLHQLLGLTQHGGLGEDTHDHRENTRTLYINPVFRYLYMNMNYHLEHHTTPMIPFHALPAYHRVIVDQTPPPYRSLWECYREMLPALWKQATQDSDYHIVRPIPADPLAEAAAATLPRAEAAADGWLRVCAIGDIAPNDALGFTWEGATYALYRLADGSLVASDGLCTHGKGNLNEGLVTDGCIECPKHNGRFDLRTGAPVRRPVRVSLRMYPAEQRGPAIFVHLTALPTEAGA